MDSYPGIELRIRTEHYELLSGRSDTLHFELMRMWLENGWSGDQWYPVGGTMLRAVIVEIRAVDIPALPSAPSFAYELFGIDAADADVALANIEAAELGGQAAELADAAAADTAAPVSPAMVRDTGAVLLTEPEAKPSRARLRTGL